MDDHELMFELSHSGRLEALHMLNEKPQRLTDISKALGLTSAEVSRHLGRLSKANLIIKDGKGRYSTTSFGTIILHELSNLKFLTKYNKYFLKHDISVLPDELRWLSALSKCEIVEGTLEIMSMVEDLTKNAKRYVRIMSNQLMRTMVDVNVQKAKKGVVIKVIYPKDVDLPDSFRPKKGLSLEVRLIDEVKFSMKSNEKVAGIVLPNLNGKIDYEFGLIGSDPSFTRWAEILFDHFWQKADFAF
ncbi:MAG: ArsR family transcriptional regulator [Thermoplasmata archaeon]|nr:MAG: ArsR family transcriptional regulator [Thermoplasmata archaeon]